MSKIHLIAGPVGVGKTTFAKGLCRKKGAGLFSIDEWMTILFTPDLKGDIDYRWAMERIGRMENLIWSHVGQLMALDVDVVLDLGLLQRDHREKFYRLAEKESFDICLHWLAADRAVRWQRVQGRNEDKGDTYSMTVDRDMFDFCEGLVEEPSGDELNITEIHQS